MLAYKSNIKVWGKKIKLILSMIFINIFKASNIMVRIIYLSNYSNCIIIIINQFK